MKVHNVIKLLIFVLISTNLLATNGRSPAVEPISSISIDEAPQLSGPQKHHYLDFNHKKSAKLNKNGRVYTQNDYLQGLQSKKENSFNVAFDTLAYSLLCLLLILPLAIRYGAFKLYTNKHANREVPDERKNVVELNQHLQGKKSTDSSKEEEDDDISKAS